MTNAQWVTVPILDARLVSLEGKLNASIQELRHELKSDILRLEARLEATKAELVRWVFLVMLGNVALSAAATALQLSGSMLAKTMAKSASTCLACAMVF